MSEEKQHGQVLKGFRAHGGMGFPLQASRHRGLAGRKHLALFISFLISHTAGSVMGHLSEGRGTSCARSG